MFFVGLYIYTLHLLVNPISSRIELSLFFISVLKYTFQDADFIDIYGELCVLDISHQLMMRVWNLLRFSKMKRIKEYCLFIVK